MAPIDANILVAAGIFAAAAFGAVGILMFARLITAELDAAERAEMADAERAETPVPYVDDYPQQDPMRKLSR